MAWDLKTFKIGREETPLVIIDDFHPTPETLVDQAESKAFTANAPYYPGIRAPISTEYFKPVFQPLGKVLRDIFGYSQGAQLQECHFSLTTTADKDLSELQSLPHVDGGHHKKVALLHYLCGPAYGGTGFYRHNRTGFEVVSADRFAPFHDGLEEDREEKGPAAIEYYRALDGRFERIESVDAKFNRAILYFGSNLHSVHPGDSTNRFSPNPGLGRLTINTFINP